MILKRLPTGMLASNCYILGDKNEGIIIDPGANRGDILEMVKRTGFKIKYIILTHSHIDHIISVDEIRYKLNAKVLIHEAEGEFLSDPMKNGSVLFGVRETFSPADVLLKDGDVVNLEGLKLKIIHTPGHTPGGICIKVDDNLFTGDTLFNMSIGRTDLGDGDYDDLINSIKNKIMVLNDKIVVYPGHGTATTIGYERKHNPFI